MDWEQLKAQCMACRSCGLCTTRNNVVFEAGNREAKLMFVGEGPGEQEDRQGIPFVGAAGQFLDEMLSIIDVDRKRCYIANIVKCRPPQNRDPLETEQEACLPFLEAQIQLVQPKILVCLGRIAAQKLIRPDYRITREHGQWVEKAGVAMTALYHPAAILRDPGKRPETFDDLKSLQAKIRQVCSRTYGLT